MKKYLLYGLLALYLSICGFVYAGESDFTVEDNTTSSGFSIKEDTGDTTIARFRGDGNVGIATTSPTEKLEVNGNIKISGTGNGVKFADGTSQTTAATGGGGSGDGHSLDASDGAPTDALFVDSSGNVGIGTTAPNAQLTVLGSGIQVTPNANTRLLVQDSATTVTGARINIISGNATEAILEFGDPEDVDAGAIQYRHSTQLLTFRNLANDRMVIDSIGNVGIGTTAPEANLQVAEGADMQLHFRTMGGVTGFAARNGGNNGDVPLQMEASRFSLMSGNVGIGTTNPQGKLDVNGTIFQRGSSLHADYVFETDYNLESIDTHTEFMWKEKHLKAIPKAKADENGMEIVEVGSHRKGIVEELEKAHIYIDQLHKQMKAMEERLAKIESDSKRR